MEILRQIRSQKQSAHNIIHPNQALLQNKHHFEALLLLLKSYLPSFFNLSSYQSYFSQSNHMENMEGLLIVYNLSP